MTPRRKRLLVVLGVLAGIGIASALVFRALSENMMLFYDPSQVVAGEAPHGAHRARDGNARLSALQ